ncbi:DUF4147 domain-containing protein [Candidatus Peregrinibacteria bacterium]|nr:DUF4147 domain-containing protein [Candidatus Peregrinibacteria bacterium]
MIKSRGQLLNNIALKLKKRREMLLDVANFVLENCTPQKLLQGKLSKQSLKKFNKVAVISIGKAARGMAKAVLPMLGRKPDYVLLADKGHPLPTQDGIRNTKKIIKISRRLGEKDLAIVLISGGGSAMCVAPAHGISLKDKISVTRALLKSGATINEINVVRKHLSQVKGGRLAALLYPATVLGFVISDVVGNDLSTIASGPLSPDKSTFRDVLKILEIYEIRIPRSVSKYLECGLKDENLETPKPREKYFGKVKVQIIADHKTILEKALMKAKEMKLKTFTIDREITGEAREVARNFVSRARKNALLIGAGETTVTCKGHGCGGRNQEFVLSGLKYTDDTQVLLSIGTDGVDGVGPEPIAGAIGDIVNFKNAQVANLNIDTHLKNNDSYSFFKKTGGLIRTGPTGTNLGDLMMILG